MVLGTAGAALRHGRRVTASIAMVGTATVVQGCPPEKQLQLRRPRSKVVQCAQDADSRDARLGRHGEAWRPGFNWWPDDKLRAPRWPGPHPRPGERVFTRAEVSACDGQGGDCKVLVTYREGVYDITSFVAEHPGGNFIMQAAGGPIDRWWAHWGQHHMSLEAAQALDRLRIGRLADYKEEEDVDEEKGGGGVYDEEQSAPYRSDKRRLSESLSEMPYQSVTKCSALAQSYLTPPGAFFVRNHAPVPYVAEEEADSHIVTFSLDGDEVAALTLQELRERFKMTRVTSVLQCTGNRAAENFANNGPNPAVSDFDVIGLGMLGNATWGGVRLSDVLREVFPKACSLAKAPNSRDDLHVTFEGLDGFYSSTPLSQVLCEENDCLLAMDMNGNALPPDHGFPLRAVLPGAPGVRQVKWLSNISVGSQSDSPWIRQYYRDIRTGLPFQKLPLNSVILSPEAGDVIQEVGPGTDTVLAVRGVAYRGGAESAVASVEVSADHGHTWQQARLLSEELAPSDAAPREGSAEGAKGGNHGWVRFEAQLLLPVAQLPGCGGPLTEIWCRATTASGERQPERSQPSKGYAYNGYHKVPVVRRNDQK